MPRQVDPPAGGGGRGRGFLTSNSKPRASRADELVYRQRSCPSRWGVQGWAAAGARERGSGADILRMHGAPGGQFPEGRWVGRGLGQLLAHLFSAKPNWGGGGRVVAGRDRHPGAGSIPRLEMAPFSRDGQCGEEEGRQRGFPALPTSRTWAETVAEEAGPAGLGSPHPRRCSLEGLPLLPELLHGAGGRGRGRGRAHVLLGFP